LVTDFPGYRIVKQLGVGAGSKLFSAVELKTGRTVAIKHMVREKPDDDRFFAQAENEHSICTKLDHPSLRKVYSIHRVRKLLQTKELLLVMEYVEGLDLEKARPNRLNTFIKVFQAVAQGLDAMHEAGFLHTDIKPTNIMVAKGGSVKIIDFGQSCPINHRKERIQGTPDYIAPEQVNRLPLGRGTDIFNLGATMYWVLTSNTYPTELQGVDSLPGRTVLRSKKPIAPNELNSKIPKALSQLVMECCRKNPAERPSDMKQISSRLTVVKKLWTKFRDDVRAQAGETPPQVKPQQVTAKEEDE